jgi:hypothetical protein
MVLDFMSEGAEAKVIEALGGRKPDLVLRYAGSACFCLASERLILGFTATWLPLIAALLQ